MNKKIGLFLIISFLCAQFYTAAHMAEHHFEEHEHDNNICSVYYFSEQAKSADTASIVNSVVALFPNLLLITYINSTPSSKLYGQQQARAPPVFS